ETGGAHSGIFRRELEYFGQEHRQVNTHGNEPTEGEEIEEAEHPAHMIREWLQKFPQSLRWEVAWSILRPGQENQEPNCQQTAKRPKSVALSKADKQKRRTKCRQRLSDVSGAINAQGKPLPFGRVPTTYEAHAHGKTGQSNSCYESKNQE